MTTVERVAARIIARSDAAHPADAVLRAELKAERLTRAESRRVAEAVFGWFRWRGWLDPSGEVAAQLPRARELDFRFASDPFSFSTEDLKRAVPDWIGEELTLTREWLLSLQTRPVLWLRAKRGTAQHLAETLGDGARGEGILDDAVEYLGDEDLFRAPEFHAGDFEVQDMASQLVGLLSNPQPGETWWDACAGEGGKLLHLSDLMQNKGLIWASDRSEWRLASLKQRAARAKAFNYRLALVGWCREAADENEIRRGAHGCAVQRSGNLGSATRTRAGRRRWKMCGNWQRCSRTGVARGGEREARRQTYLLRSVP